MSGGGGHEIYDPATNAWTRVAELERGRASHSATLLADGRVLVAGGIEYPVVDGFNLRGTATAEIYDPALNTWSPAASMPIARRNHSAVRLADGKVLLSGFRVYLAAMSMNTAGSGGAAL